MDSNKTNAFKILSSSDVGVNFNQSIRAVSLFLCLVNSCLVMILYFYYYWFFFCVTMKHCTNLLNRSIVYWTLKSTLVNTASIIVELLSLFSLYQKLPVQFHARLYCLSFIPTSSHYKNHHTSFVETKNISISNLLELEIT